MRHLKFSFLLAFMLVTAACANQWQTIEQPLQRTLEDISCPTAISEAYDVLLYAIESNGQLPSRQELQKLMDQQALQVWSNDVATEDSKLIQAQLLAFYDSIAVALSAETDVEVIKQYLAAFEVGIVDAFPLASHHADIQSHFHAAQSVAIQSGIRCENPDPRPNPQPEPEPNPNPQPEPTPAIRNLSDSGRAVLSVAYQSCSSLDVRALNSSTTHLSGIAITGTHSDGNGKKREISSLSTVQQTHPYIRGISYGANCFRVADKPLIYDYGGKPYTTASNNEFLSFFRNAGSGTSVLGVDCSGYVFSALAYAGYKFDPNKVFKASLVNGVPARAYMEPARNGMPCIDKIKVGQSGILEEGDLIATRGHIVIVDRLGADAFGLGNVQSASQCSSISYRNFDFTILQSSPSKGGVGINKHHIVDYLSSNSDYRQALESYVRQACTASFQNKDVLVEGLAAQVVRHRADASCRVAPMQFEHSDCVEICSNIK